MTVVAGSAGVERVLRSGGLVCPPCGGRLAPWGWARVRRLRGDRVTVAVRPRRARCGRCRVTQVLLPSLMLARRADTVEVIGAALAAKAAGMGTRRAAAGVGRPVSTVRGWLSRLAVTGRRVLAVLAAAGALLGCDVSPAAPTVGLVAGVLEAVGGLARGAARRLSGSSSPWRLVAVVTDGGLLSPSGPVMPRWLADAPNTSARLAGRGLSR